MSLLYLDGFDHLASADLPMKYSVSGSPTVTTTGARTNRCVQMVTNQNIQRTVSVTSQILFVGVAVKVDSLVAGNELCAILDSGTVQGHIVLNANGTMSVYRATGTSNLLGTTTFAMSTGTWYYVEFGWAVHPTSGVINLSVDGVNVLTLTGQNTRAGSTNTCNGYKLTGQTSATNSFDDLYITNAVGASPHNTFLGPGRVETLYPSSLGEFNEWTSSTAPGSQAGDVNEALANGDTNFNYTSITGNRETYNFGSLSGPSQRVLGVMAVGIVRNDDGGSHSVKVSSRPLSTWYYGIAQGITAAYAAYSQVWATSPQTGALWTVAELNSTQFGIKLES